jgi:uncharacterized protein
MRRMIMIFARWSVAIACALLVLSVPVMAREPAAPLADAAERHDAATVGTLLAGGADVKAAQPDGMTALHWATYHDNAELVQSLIKAGADVSAANRYGVTPLSLGCLNGNGEIVQSLLAAGADPNTQQPGGETVLMTASRTGRLPPVAALIERGADLNATERNGQTALMWAAADGHTDIVNVLLNAGADATTRLKSGFTAFFFAAREGRTEVLRRLLQAGIDVNAPLQADEVPGKKREPDTNALLLAVESGHFEAAIALLDAGADPNGHPGGYTALHALTWVRKPIRGDGNPPPIGSGNLTSADFARLLVQRGADVNMRLENGTSARGRFTTTGSTAFVLAARASDTPFLRLLVELGADPQIPNADHCTALMAATGVGALGDGDDTAGTEEEAIEAVRLLLELGADINAVDDNGETAMHGAAYQSRFQLVALLAEQGAEVEIWNRENKWGWTPLAIARGHRPGNYRPAPDTIAAVEKVMRAAGIEPPPDLRRAGAKGYTEP